MSNTANVLPEIGSEAFWSIYDEFCDRELARFSSDTDPGDLCLKLQEILRAGHGEIGKLPRPEKGWNHPKAWLVLRNESVMDREGSHVVMYLQAGDVMTCEFGWDRDVFVTHTPIIEHVSGQFLSQRWPNAQKGLFLPLYDRSTIMKAIQAKLEMNMVRSWEKAQKESREWGWY